eukprot:SAG11_NODE_1247_length_5401_cov_2.372878_7_plen_62_part_00
MAAALLLRFVSEGNNVPDGGAMAQALAHALRLEGGAGGPIVWAVPECWQLLEGSRAAAGLY